MNQQFFVREDGPAEGPPRDYVGYGEHPPRIRWPGDAKVAVQIVVNYEEGSEKSFPMGDGVNDGMHEIPFHLEGDPRPVRRVGLRVRLAGRDLAPVPALRRRRASRSRSSRPRSRSSATRPWPRSSRARGDEAAGHGYRWSNHFEMTRDEEREAIRLGVESIERSVGTRPLGWYCREMSVNTRELIVEEGGFLYDSECYNDDLPYWTTVHGQAHLVVPYTLVVNDARYVLAQGYGSPEHFFEYAKATIDRLRDDGDDCARMMSIGLHPRFIGPAGALRCPRPLHRLRAGIRGRLVRPADRHREELRGAGAVTQRAGVAGSAVTGEARVSGPVSSRNEPA